MQSERAAAMIPTLREMRDAVDNAREDVPALAVRAEEMRLARRLLQVVEVYDDRIIGDEKRPDNSREHEHDEQDHRDQGRGV